MNKPFHRFDPRGTASRRKPNPGALQAVCARQEFVTRADPRSTPTLYLLEAAS